MGNDPVSEIVKQVTENISIRKAGEDFQVWLDVEMQHFPIAYPMTDIDEATWMALQLQMALKKLQGKGPLSWLDEIAGG